MQVLAMARPWQENLLKHNIAHMLQVAGVGMIVNLQVGNWTLPPIQSDQIIRCLSHPIHRKPLERRKWESTRIVGEAFYLLVASAMTQRPSWLLALGCTTSAGETWALQPCIK